jgi:hypothetical protein
VKYLKQKCVKINLDENIDEVFENILIENNRKDCRTNLCKQIVVLFKETFYNTKFTDEFIKKIIDLVNYDKVEELKKVIDEYNNNINTAKTKINDLFVIDNKFKVDIFDKIYKCTDVCDYICNHFNIIFKDINLGNKNLNDLLDEIISIIKKKKGKKEEKKDDDKDDKNIKDTITQLNNLKNKYTDLFKDVAKDVESLNELNFGEKFNAIIDSLYTKMCDELFKKHKDITNNPNDVKTNKNIKLLEKDITLYNRFKTTIVCLLEILTENKYINEPVTIDNIDKYVLKKGYHNEKYYNF